MDETAPERPKINQVGRSGRRDSNGGADVGQVDDQPSENDGWPCKNRTPSIHSADCVEVRCHIASEQKGGRPSGDARGDRKKQSYPDTDVDEAGNSHDCGGTGKPLGDEHPKVRGFGEMPDTATY